MANKKLGDVMTENVVYLTPTDTVRQAALEMKQLNVGVIPVCDQDRRLLGVITDRDIVTRVVAEGRSLDQPLRDCLTPNPTTGRKDWDLKDAIKMMESKQIRRLPIVEQDNRLIGIVSLGDITEGVNDKTAGQALEDISRPSRPKSTGSSSSGNVA